MTKLEGARHLQADKLHRKAVEAIERTADDASWRRAIELCTEAAALGSRIAQAELVALSGDWNLSHRILAGELGAVRSWTVLRHSIDMTRWRTPPKVSRLYSDPKVWGLNGLAEPEMCAWFIARAGSRLKPALIYDNELRRHRADSSRTNSHCSFHIEDRDLLFALLRERIAGALEISLGQMESPAVLRYLMGQEFKPHYDTPAEVHPESFRPRLITCLVSLNEGYRGGETAFPRLNIRWKGKIGNALAFWNVTDQNERHAKTLHAGLPISEGEKWMLTQWIGETPR